MTMNNEYGNRANIVRLRGIRVAPRKLRVVIDQIRGKHVDDALSTLAFIERRAADDIIKMIESGVANISQHIQDWDIDDLIVAKAFVDEGPTMRRFRPRAQGRATRINKRTSRVTIELRPRPASDHDVA